MTSDNTSPTSTNQTRLQLVVFALVAASFTNVYITQPVLPVLQDEFVASTLTVSYTVSALILGIALANMPFGALVDRISIRPIILLGSLMVAIAGLVCAMTESLLLLIAARFVQGLFIPALTTCLAAYLARTLPAERLAIVKGSYVSASVMGGLGGRLLGGWIHTPLDWRYAFVSSAMLILVAGALALLMLPKETPRSTSTGDALSYLGLIKRRDLLQIFLVPFGAFFVFSAVFNYLPFRLEAEPYNLSTEWITLLYLTFIIGVFMGPAAGRLSNRFGGGTTIIGGTLILAVSTLLTLGSSIIAIVIALLGLCAGFFVVHTAAVGTLNQKIKSGQGRANALYVLFYYLGGGFGIILSGLVFDQVGWHGVVALFLCVLLIPFVVGIVERGKK